MGRLRPERLDAIGIKTGGTLIETGTQTGWDLRTMVPLFERIHTIELDENNYRRARRRLSGHRHVSCHLGDSRAVLPMIMDSDARTLFFLDAHYVAVKNAVGMPHDQCPLMGELRSIFALDWKVRPVILVDDAPFFGEEFWETEQAAGYDKAQWPRLAEILKLTCQHGYTCQQRKRILVIQ